MVQYSHIVLLTFKGYPQLASWFEELADATGNENGPFLPIIAIAIAMQY